MSTDKGKRHRRQSVIYADDIRYPGEWSDWKWNHDEQSWRKERAISRNKVEAVYKRTLDEEEDPERTPKPTARALSVQREPRSSTKELSPPTTTTTDQYSEHDGYTTDPDPMAQLTDSVHNTNLSTLPQILNDNPVTEVHVTTVDPYTSAESLDKNYRVHDGFEFRFGRVFKILWSEPEGCTRGAKGGTLISEKRGKFGERVSQKVRRFVIVSIKKGHCICLPIMTYQGQGTGKNGVHAEDHAIIYTSQPILMPGEKNLAKAPIRVIPYSSQHRLEAASRLNYAKVYTIEYNVKVYFIGRVATDSEWQLVAAYNIVHPPLSRGNRGLPPSTRPPSDYAPPSASFDESPGIPPWHRTSDPPATSPGLSPGYTLAPAPTSSAYYMGVPQSSTPSESRYTYDQPSTSDAARTTRERPARSVRSESFPENTRSNWQSQEQQRPAQSMQGSYPNVSYSTMGPVQMTNLSQHQQPGYSYPADQFQLSRDQHYQQGQYHSQGRYPPQGQHPPPGQYSVQPQHPQQPRYPPQGGAGTGYQSDSRDRHYYEEHHSQRPYREDPDNRDLYDP